MQVCISRLLFIPTNVFSHQVSELGASYFSLKTNGSIISAYDRTTYQRLIPYHLADLQTFPANILDSLKKGFTVSINGGKGHAVAIDEAHEMLINKDLKMAISRPTKSYLQTHLFSYVIESSLTKISFSSYFLYFKQKHHHYLMYLLIHLQSKKEENITSMMTEISNKDLLPANLTTNRGLVNVFTEKKATPEQSFDMMNFREIGGKDLTNFVNHHILVPLHQ